MTDQRQPVAYDVCVVGYGPTGATLANLLGLQGLSVLVLERESAAYHLPRAVQFDAEVMRVFQAIGLADAIRPFTHVSPGTHFVDPTGRVLLAWHRPMEPGPEGWHASYRFHQPDLERVLRHGLAWYPNVTVKSLHALAGLAPHADGVTIAVDGGAMFEARYVVGCDGARSTVRQAMGSALADLGFRERWLVIDAVLKRPRPDLGDFTRQFCDPARPATYVRGAGDRRRWEISLHEDEDTATMERPDQVWRLLAPWITRDEATLERAVCYTFHSAVATQWRNGRLLIAGDAAHLTPPFLGQGMCAGIRDAANLGWKLGRVLRGLDADALLDTYQSERDPHVREYIEMAVRLGGLINTKAAESALAVGSSAGDGEAPRMQSLAPRLGPGLRAGWDGFAGRPAPQPLLADGTRLDDRVGYRPALLLRPDAGLTEADRTRLERRDVAVIDDDGVQAWLRERDCTAVGVRPDRYVLGAARTPSEVAALAAGL